MPETTFPDVRLHKPRFAMCGEYRKLYGNLHKRYVDSSVCYCVRCRRSDIEVDDWREKLFRHVETCTTCPKEPTT